MDGAATFGANVPANVFDAYKKAVYRAPPAQFAVDMLPPAKQGNSYSYGMRIIPLTTSLDDRSSIFSAISDRCIDVEYDVYRRWEDCLAFQQLIEEEYRVKSLQKRQRLMGGKSSKPKSGLYSSQSSAASFESLPDGPDVRTIAKDFHQLVPRLTKKATLFRASPATINQRHKEMQTFIEYLFHEDQPLLIKELLKERKVTDFFGYWRRDHDLATANRGTIPPDSISATIESMYFRDRSSSRASSSPFSSPSRYSTSSFSSPGRYSTSSFSSPGRYSTSSSASSSPTRPVSSASSSSTERAVDVINKYRRRLSTSSSSSDSSSATSRRLSTSSDEGSITSVTSIEASVPSILVSDDTVDDKTRKYTSHQSLSDYDFKPSKYASQHLSEYEFTISSAPSIIEDIPEDSEYFRLEDDMAPVPIHVRRPKGLVGGRRSNRACSIYSVRPESAYSSIYESDRSSIPPEGTGFRESWQTTSTVSDLLDGLDITLPEDEELSRDPRSASRDSIATINTIMTHRSETESILNGLKGTYAFSVRSRSRESVATFMTTDSANAMFPRSSARDSVATFMTTDSSAAMFPSVRDSVCSVATITAPTDSVTPRNVERFADVPTSVSEHDRPESMISLDAGERLDASFFDEFPMPWGLSFPSRPETPVLPLKPARSVTPEPKHTRHRSSSFSVSSEPSSPPPPAGTISIKAAYDSSIIILRVSNTISLDALKQRLYAKFVKQEGQELSKSFIIAAVSNVSFSGQPKTLAHKRSSSLSSIPSERSVLAESRQLQSINNQTEWERCVTAHNTSKITLRIFDN